MTRPAFVVLAAGESARLGRCKATVELGPRRAIEWLLDAGASADGAPPLVVTGAHPAEIAAVVGARAEIVHNEGWRAGRTGSVALAVARRSGLDLVLAPIDVPLVPPEVVASLVRAWVAAGSPAHGWLAPAVRAARIDDADGADRAGGASERFLFGHPVLAGRELLSEVPLLGPDEPLRALRARAQPRWWVEVGTSAVLDDLDDETSLSRLRQRLQPTPEPGR